MRVRTLALAVAALAVLSGCATTGPAAPDSTTATTDSPTPTTATTAATTAPTTTTTEGSCTRYDIVAPEKPPAFEASSAKSFAVAFERRYQLARLDATYEDLTVSQSGWRDVSANATGGAIEVTVTFYAYWSAGDTSGKGGYPTTYRFADGQVSRGGTPIRCGE